MWEQALLSWTNWLYFWIIYSKKNGHSFEFLFFWSGKKKQKGLLSQNLIYPFAPTRLEFQLPRSDDGLENAQSRNGLPQKNKYKRAMYICKTALYICKKALYVRKRALYMLSKESHIYPNQHSRNGFLQKSPVCPQKSPV